MAAAGAALAACAPPAMPAAPGPAATEAAAGAAPAAEGRTVRLAVGGWAEQGTKDLLANTGFTDQTGINVEVLLRTDTKETELARMAAAVQAGSTPYDVLDFEDELATSFSQAGYMVGLDDLVSDEVWNDFSQSMKDNMAIWSTYNGELFRVLHNWECPYWWYRGDWFAEKGVEVPKTWDDVRALGPVFTDEGSNVWASVDGLIKGAFMNVYLAWVTLQAGGSPFDVGPEYEQALTYIHDLMYVDKVLNPASLQKDYNQQNADYIADRVAFMRQWPFFYDVATSADNEAWYTPEKVQLALPPEGPGGPNNLTYAAGWGFGIVNGTPVPDEAAQLFQHLIAVDTNVEAVKTSFWFLSDRASVLAAAEERFPATGLKMYSAANAIGIRPFHPQFVEALTIIEDTAAAYLTDQVTLEQSMQQAKDQLAQLGGS
jgi:multiple sugar transport system substrate-binding protein